MFRFFGAFAARYRYIVIIGWIVIAAVLIVTAPNLDDVSSTDQRDFLPADAPFAHAQDVYEAAFPAEFAASSTMLLIDTGEGGSARQPNITAYIERVEAYLNSDEAPENIAEVATPLTDPLLADALYSPDDRIALIAVSLTTPTDAAQTTEAVNAIDDWLEANPPEGFDIYQTGEAGLNAQAEESTFTTIDRTIMITFALVIVALLLIYRSPVSPLIPLFSVTIALIATIGVIGHLAQLDVINVIAQVNALLVVVMYGAGTDYNLFLISRFREEMAERDDVKQSVEHTVRLVGETIASSAGTVFVGFSALLFAEIGMLRSAGPMLAIGILVSLAAGLTLTPALLAVLGNRAFWPNKASHRSAGRFYKVTSKFVSNRPLTTIIVIVLLMIPFSVHGLTSELNYDFVDQLPPEIGSVRAYNLLREHMGGGTLFPINVIVTGRDPAAVPQEIAALSDEFAALPGVTDVRSVSNPLGAGHADVHDLLTVSGQLRLLLLDDGGGMPDDTGTLIDSIRAYLDTVAGLYPELSTDPDLQTIRDLLDGGLIQLMLRQNDLRTAVESLIEKIDALPPQTLLPPTRDGELFASLRPVVESYLTADGSAYRIDVILDNPLGDEAHALVAQLRDMLAAYDSGDAVASGFAAVMTDLARTMDRDTIRAAVFILTGVFVVLLIMLRSVVAPLYLICTVVLSFTCTLGLTGLFFQYVMGVEHLSWMLPIFSFVFLVGLGIDYSIFLFGRIKEEVAHHGMREGVHVAVAATGAIITSAAVILAGTFAGMVTGEIAFLQQMGFAVFIGVLIDAFVVRTMLDPALAAIFGRWTWFPGGVPGSDAHAEEKTAARVAART